MHFKLKLVHNENFKIQLGPWRDISKNIPNPTHHNFFFILKNISKFRRKKKLKIVAW